MKLIAFIYPVSKGDSNRYITLRRIALFFSVGILFLTTNCSEILSVPNISHERVELLSPSEGATVDELPVTFSWVEIEDASHYRIQVFTPSIARSERMLIDSILTTAFYTDSLTAENIEWRVRAENSAYQSAYSARKFELKTAAIGNDSVRVLAPKEGLVQTDLELFFWWDLLATAEQYNIQIGQPSFEELEKMILDSTLTKSNFSYKLEKSGNYQWRIRGEKGGESTPYTIRNFTIERDASLANETIHLLAPREDIAFPTGALIQFSWAQNEKISQYRIQIATPNFEDTEQYSIDTLVTATHLSRVLDAGKAYQWRVRGESENVFSPYTTRNLTVGFNTPLEDVTVKLLAPADGLTLKNQSVILSWEAIQNATHYRVQVSTPNFENAEQLVVDTLTEETGLTHTFEDNKTYQWRVKALNDFEETDYNSRTFRMQTTADLTAETVVILAPSNNASLNNANVTLSWEKLEGATSYRIQIATPSFENAQQIVSDTQTTATNHTLTLSSGTSYEWRVKAENANSETTFSTFKFSVK